MPRLGRDDLSTKKQVSVACCPLHAACSVSYAARRTFFHRILQACTAPVACCLSHAAKERTARATSSVITARTLHRRAPLPFPIRALISTLVPCCDDSYQELGDGRDDFAQEGAGAVALGGEIGHHRHALRAESPRACGSARSRCTLHGCRAARARAHRPRQRRHTHGAGNRRVRIAASGGSESAGGRGGLTPSTKRAPKTKSETASQSTIDAGCARALGISEYIRIIAAEHTYRAAAATFGIRTPAPADPCATPRARTCRAPYNSAARAARCSGCGWDG